VRAPVLLRLDGRVECGLRVVGGAVGDLGDRLARRRVLDRERLRRRAPLAADVEALRDRLDDLGLL
jgi:hypothetical protein